MTALGDRRVRTSRAVELPAVHHGRSVPLRRRSSSRCSCSGGGYTPHRPATSSARSWTTGRTAAIPDAIRPAARGAGRPAPPPPSCSRPSYSSFRPRSPQSTLVARGPTSPSTASSPCPSWSSLAGPGRSAWGSSRSSASARPRPALLRARPDRPLCRPHRGRPGRRRHGRRSSVLPALRHPGSAPRGRDVGVRGAGVHLAAQLRPTSRRSTPSADPAPGPVRSLRSQLGADLLRTSASRSRRWPGSCWPTSDGRRAGRAVLVVRDNERAAAAYGIDPVRARLTAFALAGGLRGIAGGLYAIGLGGIGLAGFQPVESLLMFTMVVVGGLGSLAGAVLGAVVFAGRPVLPPRRRAAAGDRRRAPRPRHVPARRPRTAGHGPRTGSCVARRTPRAAHRGRHGPRG